MTDQLPAIIPSGALIATDTHMVPALIADAGDQAAWRYLEFFTANIRNPSTRRAYARAHAITRPDCSIESSRGGART
jgi:hypothetical protein